MRTPARNLASLAALVALVGCGGGGPADEVTVLHTANAYGYFEDCGCSSDSTGGLAKRAWAVDSLRARAEEPILLVEAGDFTGGENAYGAALGRVMVDAMELMGYDAMTFGEWDLNQGPAYLRDVVGGKIAWVHTNYEVAGLEGMGHSTLVVEKGGRRIGLIGLMNPTITLNPAVRDSVRIDEDLVGVTRRAVASLREEGVDAVVVLSHLSYRADRALARDVDGIDLIVSGHGGKSLTGAEEAAPETWIVAPGDLGRFLGRARLAFEDGVDETPAEVAGVRGDLIVMEPELPDDPRLDPLFEEYERERQALLERELDARTTPRYFRAPETAPGETPLEAAPAEPTNPEPNPSNSSQSR